MSKHAPGDWKVSDDDPCEIESADGQFVAMVLPAPELGWNMNEERETNARLIAAAPDLLAALQNLAGLFQSLHPNHANWGDYKAALAAIARAVGPASQATGGDHE